jgi:GNAT superfamily N-acetyltransferase
VIGIREIDAGSEMEIDLVATRMRATLEEVLGEERGREMYSMEWLRDRVRFHLDPARSTGAVFVAEDGEAIVGHTIVRIERDDDAGPFGLFSTTYVAPSHRRAGVAKLLLARGEAWMRAHAMSSAATDTSESNTKLIQLFEQHGYAITLRAGTMVRLTKSLR